MNNKEIWKQINSYENYQVSSFGNIRRVNGKYIKPILVRKYYSVNLSKTGCVKMLRIHRLVAQAFHPNPENKPCVNHIDGVKTNNRADNLEWVTYSENENHSYEILGKVSPATKLTKEQVAEIKNRVISTQNGKSKKGVSNVKEIAREFGVHFGSIYNIIKKHTHAF